MSAARVLAMLELLQAHRRMTVGDLAGRLGVDERTVRRYAGTLADLGIPVAAERGRYGGYRLAPGFKLPPLMLTDDEAVAVVLGLLAAERLGLSAETPAAASAEAKISRVLPAALADRLAALRSTLGFTVRSSSGGDKPDSAILLELGAATRSGARLRIGYHDSERDIDPYGLVFHARRWYVVAYDHRSAAMRTFRADRIGSAVATGETFEPPAGFDAAAHLSRQFARMDWQWQIEVLVEADVATLRRRVPPNVAELVEEPGGVLMSCRAENLDGMAQMLAGLGHPFTVRTPDELRAAVARLATRLTAYAGR
jgi:predicted DNA-binding transcriptional regulator YafY